MEHKRVITCTCGETFTSEDKFEQHCRIEQTEAFNQAAQEWLDEHIGGEIADWHRENAFGMNGLGAAHIAEHERTDLTLEPTEDNVRNAAIEYCRDALRDGNLTSMLPDQFE